jgi:glycosyltransferase involved in cell wall biosynthesis
MIDPRVLITTYPTAFLHRGGGELELIDLCSNLRQLGIRSDIYGSGSAPLNKYDTILHYSTNPSGMEFVHEAKKVGKKIVLMPSLWWLKEPSEQEKAWTSEFFRLADRVVFKSKSEYDNTSRWVAVSDAKLAFCRWGVDSAFEEPADKELFKQAHQLNDYILWPGIIEERKNQLTAIHALKESRIPVVFLGDYRDRAYYESCVKAAPSHFKFIPHLQAKSEMLRSAIQNCKVFLEVPLEPPGLSAFEAALAKVPMVISEGPWSDEHFSGLVHFADPKSTSSIEKSVNAALDSPPAADLHKNAHNRHLLPQSLEPLVRALKLRT